MSPGDLSLHPRLDSIPPPDAEPVKLRVSLSAEARLRRGHPWLYAERVTRESRAGRPGDLAVVYDRKRRFVAVGLYDPGSPIRMRALRARRPGPVDRTLFAERIASAVARRASLAEGETDGYRVVHGESDGMPGFVADRYAETAVVKLYSHAWLPHLRDCIACLLEALPVERVVLRLSRQLSASPDALYGLEDGSVLAGSLPDVPLHFRERGLRFEVDPVRGQKTGFFLDQRDNRARVEALAHGRRVLNAFAYTGGFSVAAARGGATEVWSLDQSKPALDAARRNFASNAEVPAVAAAHHETLAGDAFHVLSELAGAGQRFGVVVVDPPAFARRRSQVAGALEAYARIAERALAVLEPGGRIVLASCSSPVTPEDFRRTVCAAAARAGRPLRGIEETGHGVDHPLDFAESRYLKCLFAET